ncbi:hypothetical protein YC2023_010519 [Brassica napus]
MRQQILLACPLKEDSRQSDGSFSVIQETLRVAHPRGSRERAEEVTKRHRQKENIYRSSCARALVQRSLQVLKDKSTGPPREVASTPQQRSPFLQGPVTTSASPSPLNPTSLRETYVGYKTGKQILSSTEIQDQGPESYKITFERVQNLEVLIKTPVYHLEKQLSSRFQHGPGLRRNQKKGKQRPVHYKHAEMERLRLAKLHMTLVSIHSHEEVPTPTLTTKLWLRPLLLSLTPGKNERPRAIEISGPHKQEYCDTSGLIQGVCILHKYCHVQGAIHKFLLLQTWKAEKAWHLESSMQHRNLIVTSFRTVECEIPTGTDSGLT